MRSLFLILEKKSFFLSGFYPPPTPLLMVRPLTETTFFKGVFLTKVRQPAPAR